MAEPNIPYCRHVLGEAEVDAVTEVLRSGWIARGPKSREFEEAFAQQVQADHAVSCANGSVALEIALRGLGIGPGDDVVVPTLTWVASAMAILKVGARPVFADVDPITHNLTTDSVAAAWTPQCRAVLAVDMGGIPHDAEGLRQWVDTHDAVLIQDAAHSLGGRFDDRVPVGGGDRAHATTFSFHPAKTITTAEGGMITTRDPALAERLRIVRSGGFTRDFPGARGRFDFQVHAIGSNHHLTELQAALGLVQLKQLSHFVAQRKTHGEALMERLAAIPSIILPQHPAGSSWNLFIVELAGDAADSQARDQLIHDLRERGILAHMHYPLLHTQPLFQAHGHASKSLPVAERYDRRALTLPLFVALTPPEIQRIGDTLQELLERDA